MNDNRRNFLKQAALAAGAFGAAAPRAARAVDFNEPVKEAQGLTAYVNDEQALFRWNNLELAAYRAHSMQKRPYFHPLAGPKSGLAVTTESALPYPHHRGVWLGLDPLNGGNYWSDQALSEGHIRSLGVELLDSGPKHATIADRCIWERSGAPSPVEDERRFTVTVLSDNLWAIDADMTLTALEDLEVAKAKHSLFAIRAASDISPIYGGILENSEGGRGAEGTYGKPARWCGYYGPRRYRPDVVEGIAVMEHPENPWAPCPWFTRDYGHLSPSPFNFLPEPWRLAKGGSVRLRYRVAVHAGDPKSAGLDAAYEDWISS